MPGEYSCLWLMWSCCIIDGQWWDTERGSSDPMSLVTAPTLGHYSPHSDVTQMSAPGPQTQKLQPDTSQLTCDDGTHLTQETLHLVTRDWWCQMMSLDASFMSLWSQQCWLRLWCCVTGFCRTSGTQWLVWPLSHTHTRVTLSTAAREDTPPCTHYNRHHHHWHRIMSRWPEGEQCHKETRERNVSLRREKVEAPWDFL